MRTIFEKVPKMPDTCVNRYLFFMLSTLKVCEKGILCIKNPLFLCLHSLSPDPR